MSKSISVTARFATSDRRAPVSNSTRMTAVSRWETKCALDQLHDEHANVHRLDLGRRDDRLLPVRPLPQRPNSLDVGVDGVGGLVVRA
jgi:hypothetical protein